MFVLLTYRFSEILHELIEMGIFSFSITATFYASTVMRLLYSHTIHCSLISHLFFLLETPFAVDDYSEIKLQVEKMVDTLLKYLLRRRSTSVVEDFMFQFLY